MSFDDKERPYILRSIKSTLHEMGTGVHGDVWVNEGHAFPPQLFPLEIVRDLVFIPLLALHFPGGATQEPNADQLET